MNKKLLILGALGLGAAYYFSKEKEKEAKKPIEKVTYDEELLEKQGFIYACNSGTYLFIVKDANKLKEYSTYVATNLLSLDQFKNIEDIDFKAFFSEYLAIFSEDCWNLYQSGSFTKAQAIGFYQAMLTVAQTLLTKVFGEIAARKIIENPDLEISNPEDAILYQQASNFYAKNIEGVLIEWKLTFDISEEDIKAQSKKSNFLVYI